MAGHMALLINQGAFTSAMQYFNISNRYRCEINIDHDYEYSLKPTSNDIKNLYRTQILPKNGVILQISGYILL